MAGLFGLFGGKAQDEAAQNVAAPGDGKAYYLDTDDAQSLGNVDYMRTSKKVRRTFPKTVNNPEMEMEKEVSAMKAVNLNEVQPVFESGLTPSETNNGATSEGVVDAPKAERRKSDSSLDMFRNMAKEMRK